MGDADIKQNTKWFRYKIQYQNNILFIVFEIASFGFFIFVIQNSPDNGCSTLDIIIISNNLPQGSC